MSIRAVLLSLMFVAAAHAQNEPPDRIDAPLFPASGTAVGENDVVYVYYAQQICGMPALEVQTPAREFDENGVRVVELVVDLVGPICLPLQILPPPTFHLYPLAPLGKGRHTIERRIFQRSSTGDLQFLHSSYASVVVGDTPNPALSGAWFDANNPGTGLFVSLLPQTDGAPNQEPLVVVYWAAEDENRQPTWYVGTGRFVDGQLDIELTKGGAQPAVQPMRFSYRGCGKAHWVDPRFPTFFTELTQLAEVSGVETCHPERLGPMVVVH